MSTAPHGHEQVREHGLWPVLTAVCLSTLLVVGLVAAINLAVPALASDAGLRPSAPQLIWIVDAYVVVFAALVIPGGVLGDRFGRRRMLILGLVLVTTGAAASAAAPGVAFLLAARAVAGAGAALVLPNCVGVLTQSLSVAQRQRAITTWALCTGLGGIVGNIGGGALLEAWSWRALFVAAAIGASVCAVAVRVTAASGGAHRRRFDAVGAALLTLTVVGVVSVLIEGPERGWLSGTAIAAGAVALCCGVAWFWWERRSASPLLDPMVFRVPRVALASTGITVAFFGCFGLFFLNASLLQYSRGFSTLQAGLATLPLALPILIGGSSLGKVFQRVALRWTVAIGFALIGGGLLLAAATATAPYIAYAGALIVLGLGFAIVTPALTMTITTALPADRAGLAGGLQSLTRELGSGLGVAVAGSVLASVFARTLQPPGSDGTAPRTVAAALHDGGFDHSTVISAYIDGSQAALIVSGLITLTLGAILVIVDHSRRDRSGGVTRQPCRT